MIVAPQAKWSLQKWPKYNTALYKVFINEPSAQFAVSLKCWFIRRRLWVVAYESLETKEKSRWVTPKVVAVSARLRELFITKFKSQFKLGFTNVVVTRAGRLREWSKWELRLYMRCISQAGLFKIFITIIYLIFAFLWPAIKSRSKKTKKRTRPICSHLDRTSLVNKVFIIWPKRGL